MPRDTGAVTASDTSRGSSSVRSVTGRWLTETPNARARASIAGRFGHRNHTTGYTRRDKGTDTAHRTTADTASDTESGCAPYPAAGPRSGR